MSPAAVVYAGPVPPLLGGIAQTGVRVVEALRDAGHVVDVRTWATQYPSLLYRGPQRDPTLRSPPGTQVTLRWWDPTSWWRTGRAASGADLLLFPWVTPLQAPAYRSLLAAARGPASVALVHNPHPHEARPFDERLTRWVLRRVHGAVTFATTTAEEVRALAPGLRVESASLPPLLDLRPQPAPPTPPYRLLFFGLVRPYKGLDVALEALVLLVERGVEVELTVAGPFWEPVETWRDRVAELGLEGRVRLRPGYVPDPEVGPLLGAHHVLVAPYRSATQSGVVPLARAARRPIATTAVGGLPESVTEGLDGALAPPEDPGAFADAVERAVGLLPTFASEDARSSSWSEVADAILRAGGVTT